MTFVGAGESQTIITGNPRIASDTADFGTGVANGLTLRNMTLQYSGGNQYILQWDSSSGGHNLTLQNVTLTGTNNGNAGSLSAISGADGLTLDHVTYNVTTVSGGATTFIFAQGDDITITGGTYHNVAATTVINIFDSIDTSVSGATFSNGNLFLQNANAAGGEATVYGNTFEDGGYLRLNQSSHVDVSGNSFTIEGSGQGIRISNTDFGGTRPAISRSRTTASPRAAPRPPRRRRSPSTPAPWRCRRSSRSSPTAATRPRGSRSRPVSWAARRARISATMGPPAPT